MTQKEKVLRHLRMNGSITPLEALGVHRVYRLAAVIHLLRRDGYDIENIGGRDMTGRNYGRYILRHAA